MDIQSLRDSLIYEPDTGVFRWRTARKQMKAGDIAGFVNSKGYRYVTLQNVLHRANRLAWFYVHGSWPVGHIDHINGDRLDNRLVNLRDVPRVVNARNRHHSAKGSTSKYLGVSRSSGANKWVAQIGMNGKVYYLGLFDCEKEAHAAYLAARQRLHE